jgi:hypothetical protein
MLKMQRGENEELHRYTASGNVRKRENTDDLCIFGFMDGTEDSNNCTDGKTQSLVDDPSECEDAAERSCPDKSCFGNPFVLDCSANNTCEDKPALCYRNSTDHKYYWNPQGPWPEKPKGFPICKEDMFKNGTENSNTCPDEYENVMNETQCRHWLTSKIRVWC